ncbi:MAG: bifunctional [glutamate--ammonia ligase]-adenylyl-L-tyrosine phosphorylase/[glutamate--ammonia-ligase] adenylyltransferase [Thauera sp.]|jgi:glutamate-ammonia-ligase adenylyltransferase|nr:bifunctional [glutamate--ammonia ligase]-adenylyl-L-tyrosine phosphorylase/[glutamate--ammonia-ligase] adenylyltransferase [Thauera sp.]
MHASVSAPPDPTAAIEHACHHSRYLGRMLTSHPWLREHLETVLGQPLDLRAMEDFLRARSSAWQGDEDARLKQSLRELRCWVLCQLIIRDLNELAPLEEVTQCMSTLAELCLRLAHDQLRAALIERHGRPLSETGWEQELLVIGMGKLGGRELNVSSDIDLIFVYPEEGNTGGSKSISNHEFFERLGKQLIRTLAEVSAHGQVFRVDMRLRPHGDSGALVCSFSSLENYFVSQGREWERYAWIKSRVLLGQRWSELRSIVRPFIFRKYLDFGAINAMRELHAQIRREVARKDRANNVKLGPGGIREIEFIAQVFQLIRGGRDTALQIRPTLEVLALLAERGVLSSAAAHELHEAYVFLRRLEHRLQYLDDAQTHDLPDRAEDLALIASAMGYSDSASLLAALDQQRQRVSAHFDSVFGDPSDEEHSLDTLWAAAADVEFTAPRLASQGLQQPEQAATQLATLKCGTRYRQLPNAIKHRFDALIPRIIEAACRTSNPDASLRHFLQLMEAIGGRAAYFALLQQYPQALPRVADLMSASRWGAQFLIRHPVVLDEILGARYLESLPDWAEFRRELAQELRAHDGDVERQMDLMREHHHAQVFRLLTLDLAGRFSVEQLADQLSELADITLELSLPCCWAGLRRRHREQPAFAVISYGKLGGKELGYASDLDLVFIYDDEAPEAGEVYARLAQRLSSWLSSQTGAGKLYDTDLRLRPNGESGLLVTTLQAFRRYQHESAWTWEHQALSRARFSAGDAAIGAAFEQIREEVLRQSRALPALRDDVLEMRQRMISAHPAPPAGQFDLKHSRGGLIDVEFLTQYLVLGHAHQHPQLCGNLGNIALLGIAAALDLIAPGPAQACADSYRELRRLQHRQRLNEQGSVVASAEVEILTPAVLELWAAVFGSQ